MGKGLESSVNSVHHSTRQVFYAQAATVNDMSIAKMNQWLAILLASVMLIACGDDANEAEKADVAEQTAAPIEVADTADAELLTVYKSPSCGCCTLWMEHVEGEGFKTETVHPENVDAVKDRYHVADDVRSCHTAISREGFVFEGHVPARHIQQFLANPPADALGLAVPSMPLGSPGMEMNDRFMPYQVLLLKKDGTSEVFARVDSPEQQYGSASQ